MPYVKPDPRKTGLPLDLPMHHISSAASTTVPDWFHCSGEKVPMTEMSRPASSSRKADSIFVAPTGISIAPPAGRWDFGSIKLPTGPWLVIQGEEDEIVDPQAVYDWLDGADAQAELVRVPETGHFFHRKLMDLRGAIKNGVRQYLPAADA